MSEKRFATFLQKINGLIDLLPELNGSEEKYSYGLIRLLGLTKGIPEIHEKFSEKMLQSLHQLCFSNLDDALREKLIEMLLEGNKPVKDIHKLLLEFLSVVREAKVHGEDFMDAMVKFSEKGVDWADIWDAAVEKSGIDLSAYRLFQLSSIKIHEDILTNSRAINPELMSISRFKIRKELFYAYITLSLWGKDAHLVLILNENEVDFNSVFSGWRWVTTKSIQRYVPLGILSKKESDMIGTFFEEVHVLLDWVEANSFALKSPEFEEKIAEVGWESYKSIFGEEDSISYIATLPSGSFSTTFTRTMPPISATQEMLDSMSGIEHDE